MLCDLVTRNGVKHAVENEKWLIFFHINYASTQQNRLNINEAKPLSSF